MSTWEQSSWEQCSARLHAAIDDAAQLPLSCLDGEAALGCLVDLQVLRAKLDAVASRALANPGAAQLAAGETGHRSVAALVAAETRANPRTVKAQQHLGTWLERLPGVRPSPP